MYRELQKRQETTLWAVQGMDAAHVQVVVEEPAQEVVVLHVLAAVMVVVNMVVKLLVKVDAATMHVKGLLTVNNIVR